MESGIGTELERNGTIALAFGLKGSVLRSAHMPCSVAEFVSGVIRYYFN